MNFKWYFRIGIAISGVILLSTSLILSACRVTPGSTQTPSAPATHAATLNPETESPTPGPSHTLFPSPTAFPTSNLIPPATSTIDRLGEPSLPSNPTQLEKGRHLFWLNCMTCHGDRGQGLTDEFRSLYVEEANCWARGCHAGHPGDQGFPIPRTVPAIISSSGKEPAFATATQLFEYLRATHPPQNPGFMPDADYWALTAYLLHENGRLKEGEVLEQEK
jgi:hypothetical protein